MSKRPLHRPVPDRGEERQLHFPPPPRWWKWVKSRFYQGNTLAEEPDDSHFAIPGPHPSFQFPTDDGSHPDFRIEWWYLSCHLFGESGARFSLQATFFRLGHETENYFLTHMALGDIENQTFSFDERSRMEGRSAFARSGCLNLKNGDWKLEGKGDECDLRLEAGIGSDWSFLLDFRPEKSRVFFGEGGLTKKDSAPSVSSYYITWPRLTIRGQIRRAGIPVPVTGEAWMDHEIASRQLGDRQVGWDWIQMQFFDGWEMMAYRIRYTDGRPPVRSMTWIDPDGHLIHISPEAFEWKTGSPWTSPETGADYPVSPTLAAPDPRSGDTLLLKFHPILEDQELRGKREIVYWEGAGNVIDEKGDKVGHSFLELTGYTGRLTEILR